MVDRNVTGIAHSGTPQPDAAPAQEGQDGPETPEASGGRTLRIVNSLTTAFFSGTHPHEAARQAVEVIGRCVEQVRVSCYLRDGPDAFGIVHSVSTADGMGSVIGCLRKPPLDWMRRYDEMLAIADAHTDSRLSPIAGSISELHVAAFLCAPLARDGEAYGALMIAAATPRAWAAGEVEMLTDVAQALSLGMQEARADEKRAAAEAELLAHRDHLQQCRHRTISAACSMRRSWRCAIPCAPADSRWSAASRPGISRSGATAICRQIIRLHGADLRGTNHPDGGAVFTFRLPGQSVDAITSADTARLPGKAVRVGSTETQRRAFPRTPPVCRPGGQTLAPW